MKFTRRAAVLPVLLLLVAPSVGCSTVASTLGFSPPIHKLTPQAEAVRASQRAPAPLPRELDKSVLAAYILEPGDTLVVEPVALDSPVRLPGSEPILPDGTIDLGQYGRPVVAGKTVEQVQADVRRLIEAVSKEKGAGDVTVRLVGRDSKVYYVLGEVSSPRAYPFIGRETVLDAIVTAGGITRQADTRKIILSRPTAPDGCRVVLPVCYDNIVQLGDTSTNYQLLPGDRIYVPSKPAFEGFFTKRKQKNECNICNGPQVPCLVGGACGDAAGPPPAGLPAIPLPTPDGR